MFYIKITEVGGQFGPISCQQAHVPIVVEDIRIHNKLEQYAKYMGDISNDNTKTVIERVLDILVDLKEGLADNKYF
jgi:hypothetical protein